MTFPQITAYYAAFLGLLLLLFSIWVVKARAIVSASATVRSPR